MSRKELFLKFIKKHWQLSLFSIVLGFFASVLTLLIPIALGKYFDLMFAYHSRRAQVLDMFPFSFWENMSQFLLFFIFLVVLQFFITYAFRYFTALSGERFSKFLRELLFTHQLWIPLATYEAKGTGKYLLRYSGDMRSAQNLFTKGVLRLASDLLILLLALGFMWWFDVWVSSIVMGSLIIAILIVVWLNKHLRKVSITRRNRRSLLLAFVSERLRAIASLRAFNRYTPEILKFKKKSDGLYEIGSRYHAIYQLIYTIVPGLLYGVLTATLVVIYLRSEAHPQLLHSGNVLAYILLFLTIMPVIRRLLRAGLVWEMGLISIDKLRTVLTQATFESDRPAFHFKKGKIEAEALTFCWNKEKNVFNSLFFEIAPKSLFLFKGRPGSGKSTLLKLMMGLLIPTRGRIFIDGQDVSKVNGFSLRKYMTAVSPEFPLLGKTVFEAISYNKKKRNRTRAQKLLAHFQQDLPEEMRLQLDMPIGELGSRLSSGEIKLLQYLRAIMTRKPILLIEEPFKGLHAKVRPYIVQWLKEQHKERTIVLFSTSSNLQGLKANNTFALKQIPLDAISTTT